MAKINFQEKKDVSEKLNDGDWVIIKDSDGDDLLCVVSQVGNNRHMMIVIEECTANRKNDDIIFKRGITTEEYLSLDSDAKSIRKVDVEINVL